MSPVKILEVGGEGGSICLYGWTTRQGNWRFQRGTEERILSSLLSEEDAAGLEFKSSSPTVTGWDAALNLLSKYPWQNLYPLYVHPEFVDLVWHQILTMKDKCFRRDEWQKVCGKTSRAHTVCFSHGKDSGPWGVKITALAKVAESRWFNVVSVSYPKDMPADVRVGVLQKEFVQGDGLNVFVGSSMGGYVAAVASQRFKSIDGLFLMAPAFGIPGYNERFPYPNTEKTVVVHGWRDDVVPAANSFVFASQYEAELHILNDGHQLTESLPFICTLFGRFLDSLLEHRKC